MDKKKPDTMPGFFKLKSDYSKLWFWISLIDEICLHIQASFFSSGFFGCFSFNRGVGCFV